MKKLVMCLILIISSSLNAQANEREKYLNSKWKLSKTQFEYLNNYQILSDATVETTNKKQSFDFQAMAMHKKNCKKVLRKLSLLENYKNWVSFIKRSTYDDKSKLFTIKADHPVLPFPMIVHIIVERPTKPGRYNFTFPTGMFKGLEGHFEITEFDNKCHVYGESHWSGTETKFPDIIIEIFAETLSRIGGEMLMRKS